MSFGSKERVWMADGAVYANVRPAECYHSTPNCPNMVKNEATFFTAKATKYASVEDAFNAGHMRPCEYCCSRLSVELEGEGKHVRLTVEQLDVLRIVRRLAEPEGAHVTLRAIAAARRRHIGTCYAIVAALQKKRLVKKDYTPGHRKARHGTVAPTPLGVRVLAVLGQGDHK